MDANKSLTLEQCDNLLAIVKTRFEKNRTRHEKLTWAELQEKLVMSPKKLWSLNEMEQSGGEPDVVACDEKTAEYIFYDCSPESPVERRSLCYDQEAWAARKANKPKTSAADMAAAMGVEILTEAQYRALQQLGEFDLKTSSWVVTPVEIRKHGGALFCDRRYNHVFLYHNGADSYYAARGFRASLRV